MSVLFDGAADRLQLASPITTIPTATTIIAWIKPAAFATRDTIFAYYNSSTDRYHGPYTFTGGKLRFRAPWTTQSGVWESAASSIASGAWQAIAVTYDFGSAANDPLLYRKAEGGSFQTLSVTEVQTPTGSADPVANGNWVGGVVTSYPYNGRIAYVRVFNSILNATQIEAEMDSATGVLSPTINLALVANTNDTSGNSHNGTLGGDAVLDGDNPTLGAGALKTQSVAGAITPTGVLTDTQISIASLQGEITPYGSVIAQLVGLKNKAVAGGITPSGGLVALHIGGGVHVLATQSGLIVPTGALFAQKLVAGASSSFLLRFLQPRTD